MGTRSAHKELRPTARLLAAISVLLWSGMAPAAPPNMLDPNLQLVDLTDLIGDLPLSANSSTQILWQTEPWEDATLGYPSLVKNDHGLNQDGKYYLYYAHHNINSGIGLTVADTITGLYTKMPRALANPHYPNPPGDPDHFSSPSVVWNEDEDLWFMYFHYYNHYWGGAGDPPGEAWSTNNPGMGHQMTGLATTADLSSNNWTIWTDPVWSRVSVYDIVPVLPTTDEPWMQSQSSYHAIQRLPDGQWLAFMRGTPVTGGPTVGFGTSTNGRSWDYFPQNPVIAPGKSWTVDTTEYRPKFIGYLGKNESNEDEYLVAWAEHSNPHIIYSKTTDFISFERDPRGYADWGIGDDGIVSAYRQGDTLYLFSGKNVYTMPLDVHLPGDVSGDGWVGGDDLSIIITNWGEFVTDRQLGDLNDDGFVGGDDYTEVLSYWGTGTPPDPLVTSVPEPATLALLFLGGLAMLRRNRPT